MPNPDKTNLQKITYKELLTLCDSGKQIQNIEILEHVYINSINCRTLEFHNCKFQKLQIELVLSRLTISNCDFKEIDIEGDIDNLNLLNIDSEGSIIHVNKATIQKIGIHNCQMIDKFIFEDTVDAGELSCFKSNINVLGLLGTFKKVFLNLGNTIGVIAFNGKFDDVKITNEGISDESIHPTKSIFFRLHTAPTFV